MTPTPALSTASPQVHTIQDISGTMSVVVEVMMVAINILPIVFILRYKNVTNRCVTDRIILTLSITDILSVVVPTPLGIVSHFKRRWVGGIVTCQIYRITTLWFQLSSMLLVTCLCFDRYLAMRTSLFYTISVRNIFTNFRCLVLVLFTIAFFVACLPLMGLAPVAFSDSRCDSWFTAFPKREKQNIFFIVILFFGYSNFLVCASISLRLVTLLWKYRAKFAHVVKPRDNDVGSASFLVDRKCVMQFTRMVLAVSALHYVTWFHTLTMVLLRLTGYNVSDSAVMYAFLGTSLTGLLNPLIYPLFSASYRRGYKNIIADIGRCVTPCRQTEFQPLPAIAVNENNRLHQSRHSTTKSRSNLRRTKSMDDEPNECGLFNAAYVNSMYSAIDGMCEEREDGDLALRMKTRRRVRSLSPSSRFMIRREHCMIDSNGSSTESESITSLVMGGSSHSGSSTNGSASTASDENETRI